MSLARRVLVVLVLVAAAGSVDARARCSRSGTTTADWAAPGPHAVGHETLTLVDTSRATPPNGTYAGASSRTLVTDVWWPTDRTDPAPLIVISHGFEDARFGEAYLAEHLASRGYVAAAPDFPLSHLGAPGGATLHDVQNQPGDVSFVIDQLLQLTRTPGDPLQGHLDGKRIGVTGLSLGGLTTLLVTYHRDLRDKRIAAAMPIAPVGCFLTPRFFRTARTPLLVLQGTDDLLLPFAENGQRAFEDSRRPHLLVGLRGGSHVAFAGALAGVPPTDNYDKLVGCGALLSGLGDQLASPLDAAFAALATRGAGIDTDPAVCSAPCPADAVAAATAGMSAARQQRLARVAAAAFFDAWLGGNRAARCFLAKTFGAENPDVAVRGR
jgi:predicted dienelactone hydrolase